MCSGLALPGACGQPYMESEHVIRDFPSNAGLFIDGGGKDCYLKLPEGTNTWQLDPAKLGFAAWDLLRDGVRKSWRGHIDQPGSTGAAVDLDTPPAEPPHRTASPPRPPGKRSLRRLVVEVTS
ncbi:MAG: hypothetical protein NTW21_22535 [Verrucomicrobia bacterium]|nr:hypothetical protein [Verrucomicrobiota bacterium]